MLPRRRPLVGHSLPPFLSSSNKRTLFQCVWRWERHGWCYVFRFLLMGGRAPSDVPFIKLHTCPFHVLTHFIGWGRPGAHHQVAFKYSVVATICVPRISSATYTRSTRDVFISGDFEIERYKRGHPHGRCHNYVSHPRCYPSRGGHTAQQCNLNQHAIHSTAVSSAPTSSCCYY